MFEWLKDKLKKQEDKKENAENDNLEENVEESIEKIKIDDPLEGNGENSELEDKDELKKENDENFKTSESNEKDLITDEIEKDEEQVVNEENSTKEDNIKEELENIEIQEEEIDEINISNDVENLKEPSLIETDAISNIKEEKETQEENLENKDEAIEDKNLEDKETTSEEENLDKNTDFIKEDNSEEIKEKEEPKKTSLFQRLKEGLDKTRKEVGIKINTVIGSYVKIDDEMLEDLEDILISADVGMETTMKLIDNLRETIIREKINDPEEVKPLLMQEAKKLMNPELNTPINTDPPVIILVVGVNGV
ncbi:MAG: signal recognition particle receptor subunit alpha [Peptoniphilus rhinitidis]|nr:signal recognition particle receptor subunit alpha [Peptoniphilus rhinitidis]MDU5594798.1 signal recognition particle receptor subunit alpha [Peptoniphilus rhinitidis]